jgi:phosphoribosyl 1,2-cyclic phosphodiesterase
MQVHVLASGSSGNALLLDFEKTNILVDAGISARRIKQSLTSVGVEVEDVDGVLITHEHSDHIKGLTTLVKKYRLPVYTRQFTWEAMSCRFELPTECQHNIDVAFEVGKVKVEAFNTSHDAADPVGFSFYSGKVKCSVATDLGFVTSGVKKGLEMSEVMVLEANHDLAMLEQGSYPWYLKKRIMSNRGHLSNYDAGWALARLQRQKQTNVLLAHLSKENNRPEIVETTVSDILSKQGCLLEENINLQLTCPDKVTSLELKG